MVTDEQIAYLTKTITGAVVDSGLPNGAIGRVLYNAFLAVATREKGTKLTIREVTQICAHETENAFRLGLVR